MKLRLLTPVSLLVLLTGCSKSPSAPPEDRPADEELVEESADPGETSNQADTDPAAMVAAMNKAIEELEARTEHDASSVEVQHLLVSFKGAPRMPASVTRSPEEAEALAADLWTRLQAGEDFLSLIEKHTDDSPPGIYPMTTSSRRQMVPGFGNVGWRLEVGEYGVAPKDPDASPFGWHIIKRLK
jgi:hypothetical protein